MENIKFSEWLARRGEGLLYPDRPTLDGMPRINAFSGTDGQRKRLHLKPVTPPKPFAPTVCEVADVPHKAVVRNRLKPR